MKKPTSIVKQVYHEHISKFGEPDQSTRYDIPPTYDETKFPSFIDVMVWPADEEVHVTTFATIGMSDKAMLGAEHRVELHYSIEGVLSVELTNQITMFLANLSLYPYLNDTYFDWWHTLPNINKIPGFPSASCVLLHPTFIENGWELICTDEANVKILNLVPLTKEEHDFAKKTSISVLLDSMAEKNVSLFEPR